MRNKKLVTAVVMFLLILAAAPIMAAEKGSGNFNIKSNVLVDGVKIDEGKYKISWKADGENSEKAEVTFNASGKKDEVTVNGKIVRADNKYQYNSLGIATDASGQKVIRLIQFAGKNVRIVFD